MCDGEDRGSDPSSADQDMANKHPLFDPPVMFRAESQPSVEKLVENANLLKAEAMTAKNMIQEEYDMNLTIADTTGKRFLQLAKCAILKCDPDQVELVNLWARFWDSIYVTVPFEMRLHDERFLIYALSRPSSVDNARSSIAEFERAFDQKYISAFVMRKARYEKEHGNHDAVCIDVMLHNPRYPALQIVPDQEAKKVILSKSHTQRVCA